MSAFRLPSSCLKEIDKLCGAFLWSGPELNKRKAKVAWEVVCRPKSEGGLGLKSLRDANKVRCLKLIWRITSNPHSLWVKWISSELIRKGSFWMDKPSSALGSWMWKKLLKYRELAKDFHKKEIHDGESTSFWFDDWCSLGRLINKTGPRGVIDLGISSEATVADAFHYHRRRRHKIAILNEIEDAIEFSNQVRSPEGKDYAFWKQAARNFKPKFVTKKTWNQIRASYPIVGWYKGVWFSHATPKYNFTTWLAILNRLPTRDRMKNWSGNHQSLCMFCGQEESQNHLFFECSFASEIWHNLSSSLLNGMFTTQWDQLLQLLHKPPLNRIKTFIFRYVIHGTIYHIWRERNSRRHGETPSPQARLIKSIDCTVRNRISSIRQQGVKGFEDGLVEWFATRP